MGQMSGRSYPELPPSPAQIATLVAYVRTFSQKRAAKERGVAIQTVKNHLEELYRRLGVSSALEAVVVLGWLSVPEDGPMACGWIATCSRPRNHRGQHGGFRALVQVPGTLSSRV